MIPGDDDYTDDFDPNTDWRTAEVPMGTGMMADLLRTTPRPCPVCSGKTFIHLRQHGEVFHRMGLNIRPGNPLLRCELQVCQRCGRMDWFIPNPSALLDDPDFAATVIESKS
jgi:hypothetical protein